MDEREREREREMLRARMNVFPFHVVSVFFWRECESQTDETSSGKSHRPPDCRQCVLKPLILSSLILWTTDSHPENPKNVFSNYIFCYFIIFVTFLEV